MNNLDEVFKRLEEHFNESIPSGAFTKKQFMSRFNYSENQAGERLRKLVGDGFLQKIRIPFKLGQWAYKERLDNIHENKSCGKKIGKGKGMGTCL